jgi:hypothetical protein
MWKLLLFQSALLLVLAGPVARAGGREPMERTLILSEHPRREAATLYVRGRLATVLRLEQPCDPEQTRMVGWEGHFEPVVCSGRTVLLYPLRDITPQDRFLLRVTLTDGTEIPFIVTSHQQTYFDREADQQVNVFANREGYDAVLASLYRALRSERRLREENERYRQEETSVDHAFATLLVNGKVKQTPFRLANTIVLKSEEVDMKFEFFSGREKAAVVVHLTNTHLGKPWSLDHARLTDGSSSKARPFALRTKQEEIIPGGTGQLAFVVDKSAFISEQGLVHLTLELTRMDGNAQAMVVLDHRLIRK